jgi:enoyl-CoA hydratase
VELKYLLYERADKIGTITLNRPDVRNAIVREMLNEIHDLIHEIDWEGEVSVIILKGAGKGFSSGTDVDDFAIRENMTYQQEALFNTEILRIYNDIRNSKLAIIAQLHGFCLNSAMDLVGLADLIVVADDCLLGYPTMRCWCAGMANGWLYNMGPQWTKYFMMTGDTFNGEFAEKVGFAIKAVPEAKLSEAVLHLARRISRINKEALCGHKATVNQGLDLMGLTSLQKTAVANDIICHQSDEVRLTFGRTFGMGLPSLLQKVNEGFEPQKAPFEPLEY